MRQTSGTKDGQAKQRCHRRRYRHDIHAPASGQSNRSDQPKTRRRRKPLDTDTRAQNRTGTKKTYPGHNAGSDSGRIHGNKVVLAVGLEVNKLGGYHHEGR
jgi:hypothetical protein